MKCQGKFKYKGITERPAGEFINNRGEKISYPASYTIKLDEQTESGIYERVYKTPIDSKLIPELSKMPLYSDVFIEFDVLLYGTTVKLVPVGLVNSNK